MRWFLGTLARIARTGVTGSSIFSTYITKILTNYYNIISNTFYQGSNLMNLSYAAKPPILLVKITDSNLKIKWSDRLCKVV